MGVTIQDIADKAGVSRGTVDRALNNRGRINPEVAKRIQQIAADLGYQTNRAARALSIAKQKKKLGVLVQAADTPFMKNVLEGVHDAVREINQYGIDVSVKTIPSQDPDKALHMMQELIDEGCHALAITPTQDDRLIRLVEECHEKKIPVITFNSDLRNAPRACFIGQNAVQAGRVAAGLFSETMNIKSSIVLISGYEHNDSHQNREQGFIQELKKIRPDLMINDVQYANDKDSIAYQITKTLIPQIIDINNPDAQCGIYLAAAGLAGVCKAINELQPAGRIVLISTDLTDENIYLMKKGQVTFLIGQDAHRQGYAPLMTLFSWLVESKPIEPGMQYTDIQIRTRYTI